MNSLSNLKNNINIEPKYKEYKTEIEVNAFVSERYGTYCKDYMKRREIMECMALQGFKRRAFTALPIEQYLGTKYETINGFLRKGVIDSCDVPQDLNVAIDLINEMILCAPPLPSNVICYRAVENAKEMMHEMEFPFGKEKRYLEKGFMSTTLLFNVARSRIFDSTSEKHDIMKIYVDSGTQALGVDPICDRGECEILFPTDTFLHFINDYRDRHTGLRIYEFALIPTYMQVTSIIS